MNPNLKAFHAVIPDGIYVDDAIDFIDVVDAHTIISEITSIDRLTAAKQVVHNMR